MKFCHRRSPKKVLFETLAISTGIVSFLALVSTHIILTSTNENIVFLSVLNLAVTMIVFIFYVKKLVREHKGSGEWLIQITSQELIWQAPKGIAEKSFRLSIPDIASIICDRSNEKAESDDNINFYVITKKGSKINLMGNSGLNLYAFARTLQQLGVNYEQHC